MTAKTATANLAFLPAQMTLTPQGTAFVEAREGFVKRAYKCPANVLTIGSGFTMRSKTARAYWQRKHGRKLRRGDTITHAENAELLRLSVKEYGGPAFRAMPGALQHEFEAGFSYSFNCGPGGMGDRWVRFWREGSKKAAAARLLTSRVRGGGRVLRGLQRRRKLESDLLLHGKYGGTPGWKSHRKSAKKKHDPNLQKYQERLLRLGYAELGKADGWMGSKTQKAVLRFQKTHPDLTDDGILGKATMIAIDRALKAQDEGNAVGKIGAGIVVVGGGATILKETKEQPADMPPVQQTHVGTMWPLYIAGAAVVILLAWKAYKFLPELQHKFGELTDA